MGSPLCWDTLLTLGGASPLYTPTLSHWGGKGSLCIGMFSDISMLYGYSVLLVRVWGCFHHLFGGGGGIST